MTYPICRDCAHYRAVGDTERLCDAVVDPSDGIPANVDVFWQRVHGVCGLEGRLFKRREE